MAMIAALITANSHKLIKIKTTGLKLFKEDGFPVVIYLQMKEVLFALSVLKPSRRNGI